MRYAYFDRVLGAEIIFTVHRPHNEGSMFPDPWAAHAYVEHMFCGAASDDRSCLRAMARARSAARDTITRRKERA